VHQKGHHVRCLPLPCLVTNLCLFIINNHVHVSDTIFATNPNPTTTILTLTLLLPMPQFDNYYLKNSSRKPKGSLRRNCRILYDIVSTTTSSTTTTSSISSSLLSLSSLQHYQGTCYHHHHHQQQQVIMMVVVVVSRRRYHEQGQCCYQAGRCLASTALSACRPS